MTIKHPRALIVSLALVAFALATNGCTPFVVKAPENFVKLKRTRLPYKAVSADGVVLTVRSFSNRPEAKLKFWSKVVADELTNQRGYKLEESRELSIPGAPGKWHRFSGEYKGDQYIYVLCLFVTEDRIFAVEGGATKKEYPTYQASIDQFMRSFSLK